MRLTDYISLLRVKHWVKNGFVLAPVFFSGAFYSEWYAALIGFVSFSLMASAVYIINDTKDVRYDREIPEKANVIASGKISIGKALLLALVLSAISVLCSFHLEGWYLLVIYLFWNLMYTFVTKDIPYIEMLFVVMGFLMRLSFGGLITGVEITGWLYSEVFFLTAIIILSKRWREWMSFRKTGILSREVLRKYSKRKLFLLFCGTMLMLLSVYTMYCFSEDVIRRVTPHAWMTIPMVLAGCLRFVWLTLKEKGAINPVNVLFRDRWIQLSILAWGGVWSYLIYG